MTPFLFTQQARWLKVFLSHILKLRVKKLKNTIRYFLCPRTLEVNKESISQAISSHLLRCMQRDTSLLKVQTFRPKRNFNIC
jgi:hypothetical protein